MLRAMVDAGTLLIGFFIIAVALALMVAAIRTRAVTRPELFMRLLYLLLGLYSVVVYTGRGVDLIDSELGTILLRPIVLILYSLVLGAALAQQRINRKGG